MTAIYNEIDRQAAAWLRELISDGQITEGTVNERSIAELGAADLAGARRVHLFAGIGGWDYALKLAGWPEDREVWTGSCPCQPFSQAGKHRGTDDPRHLWPEMRRLIAECRPATVFGEQVAGPAGREWFAGVRADLESLGYAVGGGDLSAASVGAPHIRQRLFWLADSERGTAERHGFKLGAETRETQGTEAKRERVRIDAGNDGDPGRLADSNDPRPQGRGIGHVQRPGERSSRSRGAWDDWNAIEFRDGKTRRIEPGLGPLAYGIPGRVGLLRGFGNAIVPQVAATFIQAFLEAEEWGFQWPVNSDRG